MNKQIALSVEQMQHLQELGLDCSGASMCHYKVVYSLFFGEKFLEEWFLDFMNEKHYPSNFKEIDDIDGIDVSKVEEVVPAFCLQDILELFPIIYHGAYGVGIKRISEHDIEYYISLHKEDNGEYICEYDNLCGSIYISFYSSSSLDAAYQMLCWCIDNNYIKTK